MDFGHTLKVSGKVQTIFNNKIYLLKGYLSYDFIANCIFTSYYFEDKNLTVDFFISFLKLISNNKWIIDHEVRLPRPSLMNGLSIVIDNSEHFAIKAQFPGEEEMEIKDVRFYGRIFLYSETQLTDAETSQIRSFGETLKFKIQFMSHEFSRQRSINEKPLAFISHDSRDKDNIVRPIATRLQQNECPVWYDEYTLKVGDNLRENIEEGIKECKKCILILTPNFIGNNGWTKTEFNSIFTRQILKDEKVILPVWCGIDKEEVYNYSPSLLDIFGIQWSTGIDNVVSQLLKVILSNQF